MPYYVWKDKKTDTQVEVLRLMADYNVPPKEGEHELTDPDWERQVQLTNWNQAAGYRAGGKGSRGGFRPKTSINREKSG